MPEANDALPASPLGDETTAGIRGWVPILGTQAIHKWPVKIPRGLKGAGEAIAASHLLRLHSPSDPTPYLAEICREDATTIVLRTPQGIEIGRLGTDFGNPTAQAVEGIVKRAEALARAEQLRGLGSENEGGLWRHGVKVEVGKGVGGNGWGNFMEGERVNVVLRNEGVERAFVSGFRIDVAGEVMALDGTVGGRELPSGGSITFGKGEDTDNVEGVEVLWPQSVPKQQPVEERFLFVITSTPFDLSCLVNTDNSPGLDKLGYPTASANEIESPTESVSPRVLHDVIEIPFSVVPRASLAAEARTLERAAEESETTTPEDSPELLPKGTIGGILRALRHVPSFVRVVNEHTEEILVVVTKYHPNRLMTSGGLCVSNTGLSINYDTTTFETPATKKILAPKTDKKSSMGIFPLWTRREEFALISIFTGAERTPFIENDRVPTGATVYFRNRPNLMIVKHGEKEESDSSSDETPWRKVAKT